MNKENEALVVMTRTMQLRHLRLGGNPGDLQIIILSLNLDLSKYFKNAEGKYNLRGYFPALLFAEAIQHVGVIVF